MHDTGRTNSAIAAARALAPLIRSCRDEIERTRRLPAPLVAAMAEADLFRMYVPKTLGASRSIQ